MIFKRIESWCKENGISVSALEKIRGWETSSPRIDSLKKVSDFTGIPINELAGNLKK